MIHEFMINWGFAVSMVVLLISLIPYCELVGRMAARCINKVRHNSN